MLVRGLVLVIVIAAAFLLTQHSHPRDDLFCAVIGGLGTAAFLFVKPSLPLRARFRLVGIWDMMLPVLITTWAMHEDPENIDRYIVLLVFMTLFIVGMSVGIQLLLTGKK